MSKERDPDALKRELRAWYIYDFANSAFFQSAATVRDTTRTRAPRQRDKIQRSRLSCHGIQRNFARVPVDRRPPPRRSSPSQVFIPLLVDGLANDYAWSKYSETRPEYCSDLEADNLTQTNCVICVNGEGDMRQTIDPVSGTVSYSDLPVLKLPGGINPTSFLFTMISISVLFQAIVFITVGSLGDYGDYRKRGLVASSTLGAVVTCLYLIVPASNSLYWLGGLLIMIANISLGVSVVFYNSYLPLMVDDSDRVRDAVVAAESESRTAADEVRAAQEALNSEYSSKGQMYGYVGGTTCLIITVIVVAVLAALGVSSYWALGIGASISGFWWLGFSFYAFRDLPERPGPPVPPGTNLYTQGWIRTYRLLAHLAKTTPNTAWFLFLFFFFSDGYATIATVSVLFASRELCMGTVELSLLAVMVPLFAAIGGFAWFKFQQRTGWSSKSVLVLNLGLLAVLPLWGCVGFFTESVGLRNPSELYVLAVWFGGCLGSAQAYGRALFSELIPEGHEADMFALFEITDKGSSWLGPLVAAVIVQETGRVRPVLLYLLCAMVLPGAALHFLDLEESIKSARGPKAVNANEDDLVTKEQGVALKEVVE